MGDVIWWPGVGLWITAHSSVMDWVEMENMCFSFDSVMQVSCRCALGALMENCFLNPFIHLRNVGGFFLYHNEWRLNEDKGGLRQNKKKRKKKEWNLASAGPWKWVLNSRIGLFGRWSTECGSEVMTNERGPAGLCSLAAGRQLNDDCNSHLTVRVSVT